MSVGSVAFDLVNLTRTLDTLDPSWGPVHRNNHSSFALLQAINSWLLEVKSGGADHYKMGEEWAEGDRATYEGHIDTLQAAITTALSATKEIVKLGVVAGVDG